MYPDDPSLAPAVLAAQEHERVSARVKTFVAERIAQDRVETGRIHPYFGRIRASMEKQMEEPPLFDTPKIAVSLLQHWAERAKAFGENGAPGRMSAATPPSPGELLAARGRDNPNLNSLRRHVQAGEELQRFADGVAKTSLTVTLEILQGPDGTLRDATVLIASGNKSFDAYVLKSVPPSLQALGAPPSDAPGIRPEGIRSVWEVEGRVSYLRKLKKMRGQDAWYVAAAALAGVLAGRFEETTGEVDVIDVRNPHFVVRPRLLRVY
ncbi:hypothetical protein DRW03_02420 [Corallococcus sp. H22C18031201]|nr:energy transducer TonB [Citreicoccus inhibens]RJS27574.1 hypothetical protein DRW03_02420 [Corallococcus sp. H22C18031201]